FQTHEARIRGILPPDAEDAHSRIMTEEARLTRRQRFCGDDRWRSAVRVIELAIDESDGDRWKSIGGNRGRREIARREAGNRSGRENQELATLNQKLGHGSGTSLFQRR